MRNLAERARSHRLVWRIARRVVRSTFGPPSPNGVTVSGDGGAQAGGQSSEVLFALVPSERTFRRVLADLDVDALDGATCGYVADVVGESAPAPRSRSLPGRPSVNNAVPCRDRSPALPSRDH